MISSKWATLLHARYGSQNLAMQGAGRASAPTAFIDSIAIGNCYINHLPFMVADLHTDEQPPYDAIIGLPLLQLMGKVVIDFDEQQLYSVPNDDGTQVPNLSYHDLKNMYLLEYEHDGKQLTAIPDFGATRTILGHSYHENVQADPNESATAISLVGYGSDRNETSVHQIRPFKLTIGGKAIQLPMALVSDSSSFEDLIGMDVFTQCHRVIIDLDHRKLQLE